MSVVMCGGAVRIERRTADCPVCHITNSELVMSVSSSPYWAPITTCTNCGDSWGDGELLSRPFVRGWRQKSIDRAVARWEMGCPCPVRWAEGMCLIPCEHQRAEQ